MISQKERQKFKRNTDEYKKLNKLLSDLYVKTLDRNYFFQTALGNKDVSYFRLIQSFNHFIEIESDRIFNKCDVDFVRNLPEYPYDFMRKSFNERQTVLVETSNNKPNSLYVNKFSSLSFRVIKEYHRSLNCFDYSLLGEYSLYKCLLDKLSKFIKLNYRMDIYKEHQMALNVIKLSKRALFSEIVLKSSYEIKNEVELDLERDQQGKYYHKIVLLPLGVIEEYEFNFNKLKW